MRIREWFQKIGKNVSVKTIIYLFVFSVISVSMFKDKVNSLIVYRLLPTEEVTICMNEPLPVVVWTGEERKSICAQLVHEEPAEDGYRYLYRVTKTPEAYISVSLTETAEYIDISASSGEEISHVFTEDELASGTYKVYPFADSLLRLMWSLALYAAMSLVAFCVFLTLHRCFQEGRFPLKKLWNTEYSHPYRAFLAIWAVLYVVGLCQYVFHLGTPHYIPDNTVGDQAEYWNTYIIGKQGLDFTLTLPSSFRGWTNYFLPSFAQWAGMKLSIDAAKIWLLLPTLFFSWLIALILPEFYWLAAGKKAKTVSVLLFGGILSYYWDTFLIGVLTDMFSVVLFFAAILYLTKFLKGPTIPLAIKIGFTLGLLFNFRLQYFYGLLIMAFGYGIKLLVERARKKGAANAPAEEQRTPVSGKRLLLCCVVILLCLTLISIPQAIFNRNAGHTGLLPYDAPEAYVGHPVTWSGWNTFLARGLVLWPHFIGDDQILSMKTQLYQPQQETIHPAQAMDVYANSPMETIISLWKKAFTMMDVKSNINYVDRIDWRGSSGMLFSYFNYLILSVGLYTLLYNRRIPGREKFLCWMVFCGTFVPLLQGHCEWRGGLTFYIILYYQLAYRFVGEILADGEQYRGFCEGSFFRFVCFAQMLCFGISMTLWA